jgi:hypothetical protein
MVSHDRDTPSSGDDARRIGSLIHDLRHCLFVLRTGLQLLRTSSPGDEFNKLCDAMVHEERKATELLNELIVEAQLSSDDESAA